MMNRSSTLTDFGVNENEAHFASLVSTPGDINEHLVTLRNYASRCRTVTEFGCWTGTSSRALLMGIFDSIATNKRLTIVDFNQSYLEDARRKIQSFDHSGVNPPDIRYVLGSTLEIEIEETDLLFIDSLHTRQQLYHELVRHASKVHRYILGHDIVTYGYKDEHGTGGGLVDAVQSFLSENKQWRWTKTWENNNGLFLLERN